MSFDPAQVPAAVVRLTRTWRGRLILTWIVVQLALPLLYYTVRRDPHDERWAWRMFSPMRMIQCEPQFIVDDKPIDLRTRFHEGWIELAQRGRYSILESMGARLCAEQPGKRIELQMSCKQLDGSVETSPGYVICTVTDL